MKKCPLCLVLFLLSFVAWGQEQVADTDYYPSFFVPDYQQIKQDCADKHSKRYYPKLEKRFAKLDTTLDVIDLQTFYYGQAYLDDYSPYSDPQEFRQIRDILNKETTPTKEEARTVIKLSNAVISRSPAEPMAYYYKFIGQNISCEYYGGDTNELEQTRAQFGALFQVIMSTGDGMTPEQAIHVVSTSHEYLMMNIYGFHPNMQSLTHIGSHSYDLFALDSNEYGVDSLYFNIDPIVASWDNLFSSDKKEKNDALTTVDIPLGTRFVIEMKKTKRKNSKFSLLEQKTIADTLVADLDSLFRDSIPENQIVCYFCPMRLYESSETVFNCLVFRSNCRESWLYYDTYISSDGIRYNTTSNNGIPQGVMMNEMWHDDAQFLRISNIRTKR